LAPKILILLIMFVGLPGCVLSPTYRQSMNVWRALIKISPKNIWAEKNKSERRLKTVMGSEVVLLSADRDDSSRSEGCAWQVNDERQDISEEAAGNAELSASEAKGQAAHIVVETATIKPELRKHFEKVQKSSKGAVYYMDSYGNPFIDTSFLDDAKEFLDEERIDREIHARWPELVGHCYDKYDDTFHGQDYPVAHWRDYTRAVSLERWDFPAEHIVAVDPPGHAVIAKLGQIAPPRGAVIDEVAHIIGEEVIGADGRSGDIRDLAARCRGAVGSAPAVVIFDPHETGWDDDCRKYFKNEHFKILMMPRVLIEYRLTSVRARLQRNRLFVSTKCRHLRESLRDQLYDATTHKPDKKTPSKITPLWTLDHPVDALGYFCTKLWPAKVDYEKLEAEAQKRAA
jgi:hypothetical protein